jgi:hypothetical protein
MKEQLINFEAAKLAKEKGFDIDALHFYVKHHKCKVFGIDEHGRYYPSTNTPKKLYTIGQDAVLGIENVYFAPTQSLLQKWLREMNSPIVLEVNFGCIDDSESAYTWNIREYVDEGVEGTRKKDESDFWKNYDSFTHCGGDWYSTYEKALEEGLQKALKLIAND